jgi:hypothetical protein
MAPDYPWRVSKRLESAARRRPTLFERMIEGVALAIPESSKDATNKTAKEVIGREHSRGLDISVYVQQRKMPTGRYKALRSSCLTVTKD